MCLIAGSQVAFDLITTSEAARAAIEELEALSILVPRSNKRQQKREKCQFVTEAPSGCSILLAFKPPSYTLHIHESFLFCSVVSVAVLTRKASAKLGYSLSPHNYLWPAAKPNVKRQTLHAR